MTDQRPQTAEQGSTQADSGPTQPDSAAPARPPEFIDQPAKLLRIGGMVRQMLDEVRRAPLDEDGRRLLKEIHNRAILELKEILSRELAEELDSVTIPLGEEVPSESELRVTQAQLMGWLEGLFHGIQAAIFTQQLQAQAQLGELHKQALPERGRGAYL